MRLSDAIALGRTLVTPVPGQFFTEGGVGGCALGMAIKAGYDQDRFIRFDTNLIALPCDCFSGPGQTTTATLATHVAHLFDEHVFGKLDWTLDQLIDWVRKVEPQESATRACVAESVTIPIAPEEQSEEEVFAYA